MVIIDFSIFDMKVYNMSIMLFVFSVGVIVGLVFGGVMFDWMILLLFDYGMLFVLVVVLLLICVGWIWVLYCDFVVLCGDMCIDLLLLLWIIWEVV